MRDKQRCAWVGDAMLLCWLLELIGGLFMRRSKLGVGFNALFTPSQFICRNIKDIFEGREHDSAVWIVRNHSECSNRAAKYSSIHLSKDICATSVAANDDNRSDIARVHFAIEGLLKTGVPDEN